MGFLTICSRTTVVFPIVLWKILCGDKVLMEGTKLWRGRSPVPSPLRKTLTCIKSDVSQFLIDYTATVHDNYDRSKPYGYEKTPVYTALVSFLVLVCPLASICVFTTKGNNWAKASTG